MKQELELRLADVVRELYDVDVVVELTRPDAQFGDFATNVAMQLAKKLRKNPRDVATHIAEKLQNEDELTSVEIAGPGFLNLHLSDKALLGQLHTHPTRPYEGKKIVFEYSCPNAFKELHTGHLYQTIYGDIVARLLLLGGADLQRTSFGGDVGLHVAKCLWGIRAYLGGEYPEKLSEVPRDAMQRSAWISSRYVEGAKAYEEDEGVKQDIEELNKVVYGFHDDNDHQSPLAQIYWQTRQWSFDYFEAFYRLIDVAPMRYYPESETAGLGMEVVRTQLALGNLKESEGAIVFEGDENKHLHTRVFVTSKGIPTYETKDIGVIWHEKADYDFDHRYLLTGNDQKEYMRVVFAAAKQFRPELADTMTHLTNGTVRFSDGTKMSSRLGNVSRAADVVSAVEEKVGELVGDNELQREVSLGAIKYAFAKYRLGGDINFNIEETVSVQGNSGPYLQYAHARARNILAKASGVTAMPRELREEDRPLIRKLGEYSEAVSLAIHELAPHLVCNYLFELAQEFNRYYEHNHVVGSDYERHRIGIVTLYADVLKAGLTILGISAPERM